MLCILSQLKMAALFFLLELSVNNLTLGFVAFNVSLTCFHQTAFMMTRLFCSQCSEVQQTVETYLRNSWNSGQQCYNPFLLVEAERIGNNDILKRLLQAEYLSVWSRSSFQKPFPLLFEAKIAQVLFFCCCVISFSSELIWNH